MPDKFTIVGLGEVLWDVFPDGARFGGAPANFACSCASIGGDHVQVFVASSVGKDRLGKDAFRSLRKLNVETSAISELDFPTGQVLVKLDEQGCATYEFASNTAWDNMRWSDDLHSLARQCDAVCFGSLGQRSECSRETIRQFVANAKSTALKVFDINLRPPFFDDSIIQDSLQIANVLKLNEDELPAISKQFDVSGNEVEMLRALASQFELQAIALTRGANGSLLLRGGQVSDMQGMETSVVDTVGAGDAFTASFVLGLLLKHDLDQINRDAAKVAAFVCSQAGATPEFPAGLPY